MPDRYAGSPFHIAMDGLSSQMDHLEFSWHLGRQTRATGTAAVQRRILFRAMVSRLGLASLPSSLSESGVWRAGAVGRAQPSRLLIAAFVGFVASLPFEEGLVLGHEELVSVTRLLGYALFGLALLQPRVCFRRPPRAVWWFATYIGLYAISGFFQPSPLLPQIYGTVFRFGQLFVVLWVGYNLLRYERVARWSLWGFGWACVAVAGLLVVAGTDLRGGRAGRETVFGQGVDSIAAVVALGGVALIGMAYGRGGARRITKLVVWAGLLVVAAGIARTGTRGALVELGVGLMALMASRGSARTRMRNAVIVVLALLVCYGVTISSAATAGRWQATLEEGNVTGRQSIYPAAWKMFTEKPILGWGPVTIYHELGYRLRLPTRDTHNLFLRLLTELGVVGTIPVCIGLALCVRAAWRGRSGTQGLLPLALIVASLIVNLSNTYLELKWFWVVLAYSLASETYLQVRRGRWTVQSISRFDASGRPGTARGHVGQRLA
jgi:O-Antigen ligase